MGVIASTPSPFCICFPFLSDAFLLLSLWTNFPNDLDKKRTQCIKEMF